MGEALCVTVVDAIYEARSKNRIRTAETKVIEYLILLIFIFTARKAECPLL